MSQASPACRCEACRCEACRCEACRCSGQSQLSSSHSHVTTVTASGHALFVALRRTRCHGSTHRSGGRNERAPTEKGAVAWTGAFDAKVRDVTVVELSASPSNLPATVESPFSSVTAIRHGPLDGVSGAVMPTPANRQRVSPREGKTYDDPSVMDQGRGCRTYRVFTF
jgi:hypothetical protein